MKIKSLLFCIGLLSVFSTEAVYAAEDVVFSDADQQFVPLYPLTPISRVPQATLWGFTGDKTLGKGQVMLPLMLDVKKALYVAAEGSGAINSSDWMAGLGAGYRQIIHNNIFGGYLFGDYNITDHSTKFLVLNPGLESLGEVWDFRTNGYFPVGSKEKIANTEIGWESDIGNYSYVQTYGHNWADNQFREADFVRVGNGVDVEAGRSFAKLNHLKAYLGGYYFDIQNDSSITGIEGRVNYPVSNYMSLEARDSYDNDRHNTFLLGFRVKLGGINENNADSLGLAARLLDPIEHNVAASASGNSVPVKKGTVITDLGQSIVRYNDVQYVDNSAPAGGNGTFENPFNELNNGIITDISGQGVTSAHIFVEDESTPYSIGSLSVPGNYSIWGFENNFRKLASGDNRPELDGTMTFSGTSSLSSLNVEDVLASASSDVAAITVGSGANVTMDNMLVNTVDTNAAGSASINITAITVNSGTLTLNNNNTIESSTSTSSKREVAGIKATSSTININGNNNAISANSKNTANGIAAHAYGVDMNASTLNIYGSGNSISGLVSNGAGAIGVIEANASTFNIYGDSNIISADNVTITSTPTDTSAGIYVNGSILNIQGNNNEILANIFGVSATNLFGGILEVGNSTISISGDSNIINLDNDTATANTTQSYGINQSGGSLSITGSNNEISASSNTTDTNGVNAIYIAAGAGTTTNITGQGTVLTADNAGGSAYGVYVNGASDSISVTNTTFNINASGPGTAYGVYVNAAAGSVDIENDTFNVTSTSHNAYGVSLNTSTFDFNNDLTVVGSTFNIQTPVGTSYGIFNATTTPFDGGVYSTLLNNNTFTGDIISGNQVFPAPSPSPNPSEAVISLDNVRDAMFLQQYFNLNLM